MTLDETGADGLVPVSTLGDDAFLLDERHQALVGQRTGETFALGDRVKVELVEADPVQGTLLFRLDAHEPGKGAELARAAWKKGGPRAAAAPRPACRAAPPPLLTPMRRLPPEWRDLAPVMLTATLVGMTLSLAFPLLSLVLERHGVDTFGIGLNTAAGGLGIFLVAPVRRRRWCGAWAWSAASGWASASTALCMLLFPLWVDPWLWFALRLVFGMAASLMFVLSEAAVNALTPDAIRGRVLGVYATLFSLGFVAGPLVLALAGSEGWTPFLLGRGPVPGRPRAGAAAEPVGGPAGARRARAATGWSTPGGWRRWPWAACSSTPCSRRRSSRSCRSTRWTAA